MFGSKAQLRALAEAYAASDAVPAFVRVLPWFNAGTMSMFLAEVAQLHASEFVFMAMDQAGWHIAGELTVPPNIRLLIRH